MNNSSEGTEQARWGPYPCRITRSYVTLKAVYLGRQAVRDTGLPYGPVTVRISSDPSFETSGTHDGKGGVTGMSRLYAALDLKEGSEIPVYVQRAGGSWLLEVVTTAAVAQPKPSADRVFARMKFRHVHLEPFRPENLLSWEPAEEKDVFLAFGVLQEFTDFRYCCSASVAVLRALGASYEDATKPDAILIDLRTGEYVMSEWKMRSSDFKKNHKVDDVDVLIVWDHDEVDLSVLPDDVVCLRDVARTAATSLLAAEEGQA